jgi:glycosyltransferase involved in cell wall biosynthesis
LTLLHLTVDKTMTMKVLIGTVEIAGIGENLRAGFEQIGVAAETVFSTPHPFQYESNRKIPAIVRGWQWLGASLTGMRRDSLFALALLTRLHQVYALVVLCWALFRFDACIFIFGRAITNLRMELLLWRWMRKKVIFVYVGSDTRPPFVSGVHFPPSSTIDTERLIHLTRHAKKRVAFQEKYSDFCINSPLTAQLHSRPFINWFALGIPRPIDLSNIHEPPEARQPVRILHAPSRLEAKGTEMIREVIKKLSSDRYEIDYVEISNQPNAAVLEELERCDFIVDQVYSDTPMAAFATEAAVLGKPAVVGGYAAAVFSTYVRNEDTPPSLFVRPEDLENAVKKMVVDVEFRRELGRKALEFVARRWSSKAVARRYLSLLNDDFPDTWWCDPASICYVHGAGLTEQHARRLVAAMVDNYGPGSLQISDKPKLETAFLEFAQSGAEASSGTENEFVDAL